MVVMCRKSWRNDMPGPFATNGVYVRGVMGDWSWLLQERVFFIFSRRLRAALYPWPVVVHVDYFTHYILTDILYGPSPCRLKRGVV